MMLLAIATPGASQRQVITNSIGMEFVRVEPGTMMVGRFQPVCPEPDPDGADADPRTAWTEEDFEECRAAVRSQATFGFPVEITRLFYIGRYEVTQAEWQRVMGSNPSYFQGPRVEGDASRHPVESVTWEDAQQFIARLNEADGTATYRLPTEMEWEYAARAGAEEAEAALLAPDTWSSGVSAYASAEQLLERGRGATDSRIRCVVRLALLRKCRHPRGPEPCMT